MKKLICAAAALCILLSGCAAGGALGPFLTVASASQTETTAPSDENAPVITGACDLTIYEGDELEFPEDVTAADCLGAPLALTVTTEVTAQSAPGEYPLTYTALDAEGRSASVTVTVTVLEWKEGYMSLEIIRDYADALLAQLLPEGGSAEENVRAIYAWANENIVYTGTSAKNDYYQGAWVAMTARQGDCWNYFSVCKLFFERLGIPNIDVAKVPNSATDSHHYWSLVSVDGGETYYHFDATPRLGGGDFCLVTDAQLDEYSDAHNGSHNRDKSLYPATPQETLS